MRLKIIIKPIPPSVHSLFALILGSLFSAPGLAGLRTDPTIIPPEWLAGQAEQNSADGANPDSSLKDERGLPNPTEVSGGGVFVIGKTRRFAIVNGQLIKSGDTLSGSKVLSITQGEIRTEDENRSQKVYGAVEKTIRRAPAQGRRR